MTEPSELLTAHLPLIERAIAFACRRYRLSPDDAEEFGSIVKLRLIEKDYAVLRAWAGRSSLTTFIGTVVQRLALDYRIHQWGKWHTSAEAKRLGELAIALEQLLHRDGRTIEEARIALAPKHEGITREALLALAERLPERAPRRRDVELEEAAGVTQSADVEDRALEDERRALSQRVSNAMTAAIQSLPEHDQLVLQLRFENGMTIAQIARALQLNQKLLYERVKRCTLELRKVLESAGLAARDVAELIGRSESLLHFDLGNQKPRPSKRDDETAAAHSEDSQ